MRIKGLVLRLAGIEHSRFPHYSVERIGARLAGVCFSDQFGLLRDLPMPDWWHQIINVEDTPSPFEVGSLIFAPKEYRFRWIPDYKVIPHLSVYCLGIPEDAILFGSIPQLRKEGLIRERLLSELALLASKAAFRKWAVNPIDDDVTVPASHVALQVRSGRASPKNPIDRVHFVNNIYSMNVYQRKLKLLEGFSRYANRIHGQLPIMKAENLSYSAISWVAKQPELKGKIYFADLEGEEA